MKGEIFLKPKEARRLPIIEAALAGKLTNQQAANRLKLSPRQVIRLKKGVKEKGIAALAHQNRGRKPANATPDEKKQLICQLALGSYRGASSKQLSEFLADYHQLTLSDQTIRRILKKAGISNPHAKRRTRRFHRRKRKAQEGLLVLMDASPYHWLEERAGEICLHGAIDDASGKILGLYFQLNENLTGYFQVLKQMLLDHGVPQDIYSDRHTIFFSPQRNKLSPEEELEGEEVALTQFGRALAALGIGQIPAYTPQAKGRIERLWGTLQHRLVVEMRIAGIKTLEEANHFLPEFVIRYNARFGVATEDTQTAFLPAPSQEELERIICLRYERKTSNASTLSFQGRNYQLVDKKGKLISLEPRSKVYVLVGLDGKIRAELKGEIYHLQLFEDKKVSLPSVKRSVIPLDRPAYQPGLNHPWKRFVFGSQLKAALNREKAKNLITA